MNSLPLSMLEQMLRQDKPTFDENYAVELTNGELVTLGDLMNFWIEGHQDIKETKNEREPKEETKLSSEQEMENVCASTISAPKRTRRNNKVKAEKI